MFKVTFDKHKLQTELLIFAGFIYQTKTSLRENAFSSISFHFKNCETPIANSRESYDNCSNVAANVQKSICKTDGSSSEKIILSLGNDLHHKHRQTYLQIRRRANATKSGTLGSVPGWVTP